MTKSDILQLSGPALSAKVAVDVMGWTKKHYSDRDSEYDYWDGSQRMLGWDRTDPIWADWWKPHEQWDDAMLVRDTVVGAKGLFVLTNNLQYIVEIRPENLHYAMHAELAWELATPADTCHAALLALEDKP